MRPPTCKCQPSQRQWGPGSASPVPERPAKFVFGSGRHLQIMQRLRSSEYEFLSFGLPVPVSDLESSTFDTFLERILDGVLSPGRKLLTMHEAVPENFLKGRVSDPSEFSLGIADDPLRGTYQTIQKQSSKQHRKHK